MSSTKYIFVAVLLYSRLANELAARGILKPYIIHTYSHLGKIGRWFFRQKKASNWQTLAGDKIYHKLFYANVIYCCTIFIACQLKS